MIKKAPFALVRQKEGAVGIARERDKKNHEIMTARTVSEDSLMVSNEARRKLVVG